MANYVTLNHVERVLATVRAAESAAGEPRIANSWRRCLVDHKLDPARDGPPRTLTQSELKARVAPIDRLIHLAMPEIDGLFRVVRQAGYCVNLADTNAVMLVSRFTAADEGMFRRWKLYSGSIFAEEVEGTNGLGTCLAEQRAIMVYRDEHFRQHWAAMSCAVAPLFDPLGRLAGALNITSCRDDLTRTTHQLALAATEQATRRIEDMLFHEHFRDAWIVRVPLGDRDRASLIAFDGDRRVLGADRAARLAFDISDRAIARGVALSQIIDLGKHAIHVTDAAVNIHRPDGRRLGQGSIVPPRVAKNRHRLDDETSAPLRSDRLAWLAGGDPALQASVRRLRAAVVHDLPILLRGETGTGKDALARAIHAASPRHGGDYVALNCAAMPESLIDAELFGYRPGAFTGARREGSKGLIAQADGGTLFLDEIGDMPLALQTRLLRVLENREILPLGASRAVPVDIRLVSATHRDLKRMVDDGSFRADLYYRLRGMQVELPPLRRRVDRAALIRRVADEEAPGRSISGEAWGRLMAYPFPGNIRELRHVLRLAACTACNGMIEPADLDLPADMPAPARLADAARDMIEDALRAHDGRVPDAARALGVSRATLYRRIRALQISPRGG